MQAAPREQPVTRPSALVVVCCLVLVQTFRIAALGVALDPLNSPAAGAWFFPALADFAFGITAPVMALALWRLTGLGVWVGGIVWLSLSLFDFVGGLVINLAIGPPGGLDLTATEATTSLVAWIVVDVAALALLTRPPLRRHFLWSSKEAPNA